MSSLTTSTAGPHTLEPTHGPLTFEELQLAARNHALPLEILREDLTPVGSHYLLVHFDIPTVDAAAWRLRIGGAVRDPLELTLDELRARPRRRIPVTLECAGNGRARLRPRPVSQPWLLGAVGTAAWTGTPLAPLLQEAGLAPDTAELVFTGADRGIQGGEEHAYARSLTVAEATRPEIMLAYEMNGLPLPPQHGHPLRLRGRAWSGHGPVERVQVGIDGAWTDARLDSPVGAFAWHGWWLDWEATPGDHELSCMATDASGEVQPVEHRWNYQGMADNTVQRVAVTVR